MSHRAGNVLIITVLFIFCTWWAVKKYSSLGWFGEGKKSVIHHCPMEWRGPYGSIEQYNYVCMETGEKKGEIYKVDGGWRAFSHGEFMTMEQAKAAEEKGSW
jgi:hypothetical protein